MAEASSAPLDPKVLRLVEALARVIVNDQMREESEARSELAELRSTLGLEDDFPTWMRTVEALMAAFYDRVPRWGDMPLRGRIRLLTTAVRELGPSASVDLIVGRAGELVDLEIVVVASKGRRRRPAVAEVLATGL
jgi:hypothetical protein